MECILEVDAFHRTDSGGGPRSAPLILRLCGSPVSPAIRTWADRDVLRGQREVTRADIVKLLGASLKAADKVIGSLRRKGWLERAAWGEYLLIPPEQERLHHFEDDVLPASSRR